MAIRKKIYLTERIAGGGAADIFKKKNFLTKAKFIKVAKTYVVRKSQMMIDNPCLPDFVDPLSKKYHSPLSALIIKRGSGTMQD